MDTCEKNVGKLVEAFRRGEQDAGDQLFKRFEPWLKMLARVQVESRFRGKFDPSDVVQQAMIEAVRAFPSFRGRSEAEVAGWLRQILAHALAHEVRRYAGARKRDLNREVPLDQELTETSRRLGDMLPAGGASVTQQVVRHERELLLAEILERMPPDYREVIILHHLEGLSHDEVAHRMGRNAGAVRMLWVRALARLREEIQSAEKEKGSPRTTSP